MAADDLGAELAALLIEAMIESKEGGRQLSVVVKNNTGDRWKLIECSMQQGNCFVNKAPDILEPGRSASMLVKATGWWTSAEGMLLYKKETEPDNSKYCCIVHFAVNTWSWNDPFDTGVPDGTGYVGLEGPSRVSTRPLNIWTYDPKKEYPTIAVWRNSIIGMGTQHVEITIDVRKAT